MERRVVHARASRLQLMRQSLGRKRSLVERACEPACLCAVSYSFTLVHGLSLIFHSLLRGPHRCALTRLDGRAAV
jgi:hypothetical protein